MLKMLERLIERYIQEGVLKGQLLHWIQLSPIRLVNYFTALDELVGGQRMR